MYYFVFYLLLFCGLKEIYCHKSNKMFFILAYSMMSFMVMFRYGQLTDYFNYEYIYDDPDIAGISDPLYFALTKFCKGIGIGYQLYVIMIGALSMFLAFHFFDYYCNKSCVALFFFYCYVFLMLPMNAIRQGVCLCALLWGFRLLLEKKIKTFCAIALFGAFFHFSTLVLILLALLYDKKFYNSKLVVVILMLFSIIAIITPDFSSYFPGFLGDKFTGESEDIKIMQIIIRVLLILPVIYIKPEYGSSGYYAKAICIIGYCVYCMLSFHSLFAARIEVYFRTFICLFSVYIYLSDKKGTYNKSILLYMMVIHSVLFYKNMNAAIEQGDYDTNKVSMMNFPYVSIFDQEELKQYK